MTGVTILNKFSIEKIVGTYWAFESSFWSWVGIIALGLLVGLIVYFVWKMFDDEEPIFILLILLAGLFIGMIIFGVFEHDKIIEVSQYKVIADDTVTLNDFFNHYKIINKEGLIFTVELKDKDINKDDKN